MRRYIRCGLCEAGIDLESGEPCNLCGGRGGIWLEIRAGDRLTLSVGSLVREGWTLQGLTKLPDDLRAAAKACGSRGRTLEALALGEPEPEPRGRLLERSEKLRKLEARVAGYARDLESWIREALRSP